MKARKTIALFFIVSTTSILAANISAQVLSFEQCLSLSLKKSEGIKIQLQREAQASERLAQARGAIMPDIAFQYVKNYRDDIGGTISRENTDSKLTLSQPLFYGLRDWKALQISKSGLEREKLAVKTVTRSIKTSLTQGFYSLLQIDKDISNIKEIESQLEKRKTELEGRVNIGKSRDSEVLLVESQLATLKAQEEKAAGDRAKALEYLSFLTGVEPEHLSIEDNEIQNVYIENLDQYLREVQGRSDILSAQQDVAQEELKVGIARGAYYPAINLDGSLYNDRSGSLSASKWDAYLTLSLPLFHGGVDIAKSNEQKYKLKEAEERLSLVQRQSQLEVRELYRSAVSSIKQAAAYKDAYELAAKSAQMQLRDYRYGLVNNLEVIQVMMSLLDVKRNFDRATIQVKMDRVILEYSSRE